MSNYSSVFATTSVVAEISDARLEQGLKTIEKNLKDIRHHMGKGEKRPTDDVANLFREIAQIAAVFGRRITTASDETLAEDKEARFEEGKPADPTKDMSPEDAKRWKEENEKHKDNFKSASYQSVFASNRHTFYKVNEWYKTGSSYFYSTEIQKNGGLKGVTVEARARGWKCTHSSTGVVFQNDNREPKGMKLVPESQIEDGAKEAVKEFLKLDHAFRPSLPVCRIPTPLWPSSGERSLFVSGHSWHQDLGQAAR